ncbi:hypothetical protein B5G16_12180 [Alistipes sp. An66]|nr:hypothetical protein B5G16_12180 [Alistipes sp. An66]
MNNILAVDVLNPGEVAIQIAASVKARRAKLDLMRTILVACERIKLRYTSDLTIGRGLVRRANYFALNVLVLF